MPKVHITEMGGMGYLRGEFLPGVEQPGIGQQDIELGGVSQRVAIGGKCQIVRLVSEAVCHVAFGDDSVVASGETERIPANATILKRVNPGSYIAAIND